eukprot:m.112039 g.112039  ORF g.112039 m.112039 type:complete len:67 (-) comp12954_c0_seq2:1246-1446(-)
MATWANEVASLTDDLKESDQFWQTFGVDTEHGGFMCSLAHNGDLLSPAKFVCTLSDLMYTPSDKSF